MALDDESMAVNGGGSAATPAGRGGSGGGGGGGNDGGLPLPAPSADSGDSASTPSPSPSPSPPPASSTPSSGLRSTTAAGKKPPIKLKSPMGADPIEYAWPLKKGKGSMRRSEVRASRETVSTVSL